MFSKSLVALLLLGCLLAVHARARQDLLNVYLINHTHDDVGWLKTIEEYYEDEVRHIYDSVVEELQHDPSRTFIVVEVAFFSRWWTDSRTSDEQREQFRFYLENEQVEFTLGSWAMSDDAGPSWSAETNQMAEGHRWIEEVFGAEYLPRYGWHIDPFGLSAYYPTLYAKHGFHAHVINRIHYQQKEDFKADRHLEFVWRGSKSLGAETEMFTHILDSHYSFPECYNFERCPPITQANLPSKAADLVVELNKRSEWFRTNHLLVPAGDDFRWVDARVQFENWDKLIEYINDNEATFGMHLQYAKLSDYFEALNKVDIEWPIYEEDFFPQPPPSVSPNLLLWRYFFRPERVGCLSPDLVFRTGLPSACQCPPLGFQNCHISGLD
eukprot:NODE_604_length_1334_cov_3.290804_g565_i0.p1 GENE.NODE_604_length_1334_cov_3.290804_g565_i0~~NODE_604_length_1334_cov_3.290804_g565_i0.p1  ORF type:complete len:402 (+),score=70.58 NODE_604_length_1334_cov_3.290804_g565_i0:62-1207(+)